MELYIDNKIADTYAASQVPISLSVADTVDPRRLDAGYTRTVRLPMTPENDAIFAHAADVHARNGFNATEHTGRVEHEGVTLIEGPLCLGCVECSNGTGFYEVHIVGAAKEWAGRASVRSLRGTGIVYSKVLTGQTISESWTNDDPVRFLPVARQRAEGDYSSGGVIPTMKMLSSDDYHPFIHAATLLRAVFADSGYVVESDFVDGDMFSSLYISGNYPTRDVSAMKANMDFLARRLAPCTAVADSLGRVYANPYRVSFTVGNIVDSAMQDDAFTLGGCFRMDDQRVAFIPPSPVSLGFQYHLSYTTDYRMKNRYELAGFDEVYLGEQSPRKFVIANPYPDRRTSFRPGRSYSLAIFDFAAGCSYQLRYMRQTADGGSAVESSAAVGARFSTIEVAGALPVSDPVLYHRASSSSPWRLYPGDWALYDGFVGETGTTDIELTVRTAPETVTPGEPKFFDTVFFGGAEPGMNITVGSETWLRPVFYAQPTEGSPVEFADVCAHEATQMDFIDALRQMFNLRIHTDNVARVVRIEPSDGYYSTDRTVVDWTDKIDSGQPVRVEELGGELHREMAWDYRSGDGAVSSLNRRDGGRMGRWSARIESHAAADGISVWENPMFTPSLNADGVYSGARSALLVQVGDISAWTPDGTEDLNFLPKVVRYEGMKPLSGGQTWGWPLSGGSYPKLAFHAPESGYTLCFEDRDGCPGLHSYYDHEVRLWNAARRVTLSLSLDATDVCSLSFPTGNGADFRSLYRLELDGEPALYRLEEVCDYRPGDGSTKCIFIKHIPFL